MDKMLNLKEKFSNFSVHTLYFFRNISGLIIVMISIVSIVCLNALELSSDLYNLITLLTVLLLIMYYLLSKKIDSILIELLVKNIDLEKYEAYWQQHIKSKFGLKALAYHALARVAFYRGYFEESLHYFECSKNEKRQTRNSKNLLESDRKQYIIQSNIFLAKNNEHDLRSFQNVIRGVENEPYLRAILDVIYYKESNSFFEQNTDIDKTKISRLMFQFYKAQNAMLLGQHEEAQRLFSELSKENPQLFIVQEAKMMLSELKNDLSFL